MKKTDIRHLQYFLFPLDFVYDMDGDCLIDNILLYKSHEKYQIGSTSAVYKQCFTFHLNDDNDDNNDDNDDDDYNDDEHPNSHLSQSPPSNVHMTSNTPAPFFNTPNTNFVRRSSRLRARLDWLS